jgi:hypothetical protein
MRNLKEVSLRHTAQSSEASLAEPRHNLGPTGEMIAALPLDATAALARSAESPKTFQARLDIRVGRRIAESEARRTQPVVVFEHPLST